MSLSLILSCVWVIGAALIAIFPSKRNHWPAAYALIVLGVPLLVFVFYQDGIWIGLIVFAAGASTLRWPILYLGRWIGQRAVHWAGRLFTGHAD